MAESDLNTRILAALKGWDPHRVENSVGPGTPDIEYIGGQIESKKMPSWPKRPNSILRIPHYTSQQRAWHVGRCTAGGRCHVVVEVSRDVFVFDGLVAAEHLGLDFTRSDMEHKSLLWLLTWDKRKFREFIEQCNRDRT